MYLGMDWLREVGRLNILIVVVVVLMMLVIVAAVLILAESCLQLC